MGPNFNLMGKPTALCAVTLKVKVSPLWIQQLAMRATDFDESKYSDKMKVPTFIYAQRESFIVFPSWKTKTFIFSSLLARQK
jgi:hypothetical protein